MYSLTAYGDMIRDRVRMGAYATALRRAIRPGAIVIDIGTGTGIMACLACRYGARRVYAIEPADAIEVAREVARANGLGERIEFIQKPSTSVILPERADVIVSDLRGVLPLLQHHVPSIVDARTRLLKRGGVLIPRRDVIRVCVASAPDLYESRVTPWERNEYGLDMSAVSRIETNACQKCRARAEHVLLEPQPLATLDYGALESGDVRGDLHWSAERGGEAHGLIVWFDAELDGETGFTNAPGAPEVIYGQAFFPWTHPVALVPGDTVSASICAILVADEYVWTWATRISEPGGAVKAEFRQSSFFGTPRSRATLARRAAEHVAVLGEEGRLDRLVLTLLDERVPLGQIADEVFAKFPLRVRTWERALARVADLSIRYGEAP
jgi:protein arginine N-methyltransferase 1